MRYITLLLVSLLTAPAGWAADSIAITGLWQTVDDDSGKPKSVVELTERKGKIYGKVVKLFRAADEDPDPACKKCTGKRKGKKIIGMTIVQSMNADGDEWSGGTILDPANGKSYSCKMWREGANLKVRGYVGIFFRTQTWMPFTH